MSAIVRPYLLPMTLATVVAIPLGFISAIFTALIGPLLESLRSQSPFLLSHLMSEEWLKKLGFGDFVDIVIPFTTLGVIFVCLAFAKALFQLTSWYTFEKTGEQISRDLRSLLIDKVIYMDPSYTPQDSKSVTAQSELEKIAGILTQDVKMYREYFVRFYGGIPREITKILFYLIVLIMISPKLLLIFLLGLAPALAFVSKYGKKLRSRTKHVLENYSELSEWLQQRLLGIETIKHYRSESSESEKFASLTETLNRRFLSAYRVRAKVSPLIEAVGFLALAVVTHFAFAEVSSGAISGSVMVSFIATIAMLAQSASAIGKYNNSRKQGDAAKSRLLATLSQLQEMRRDKIDEHIGEMTNIAKLDRQVAISLEGVSHKYNQNHSKWDLKDIDLSFKKGCSYVVLGRSGAGKSTLFKIVLGLIKPLEGEVRFNREYKQNRTPKIGYVPQDILFAKASIAENISYPETTIDKSKIELALKSAGARDFVRELPNDLDTIIGDGGRGISGGQAQRIMLARAFYHDFDLVLIDEGTSALDPQSEKIVYECIKHLTNAQKTVIIIAHRLLAIEYVDEAIILKSGQVAYFGEASQLMQHPEYAKYLGQ